MGLPLQSGAPQATWNGKTSAIISFLNGIGAWMVGLVQEQNNEWLMVNTFDSMLTASGVQQAGGIVAYLNNLSASIQAATAQFFGAGGPTFLAAPIQATPINTDADAQAAVTAWINASSFKRPAVPIPPQLKADYAAYWTSPASSVPWADGSLTRLGDDAALYIEAATGSMYGLCAASDLNNFAKTYPGVAALWKAEYGFIPV